MTSAQVPMPPDVNQTSQYPQVAELLKLESLPPVPPPSLPAPPSTTESQILPPAPPLASAESPTTTPPQPPHNLILFIPGLYGSELSSTKTGVKWLNLLTVAKTAIFNNKKGHDIALPISWENKGNSQTQASDDLLPTDILNLSYKNWVKWSTKINGDSTNNTTVVNFPWDFRRALDEINAKFELFMMEMREKFHNHMATVVTHSTGSMIVWPTLNKHPDWFNRWYSVGGALGPGPNGLSDLGHNGFQHAVTTLASAETLWSFPTLYAFHALTAEESPETGGSFLENENGAGQVEGDLHDVEVWERLKLGVFGHGKAVSPEMKFHVAMCLKKAKEYRFLLDEGKAKLARSREEYEHLKIVVFGSDSKKTCNSLSWVEGKGVGVKTKAAKWEMGDGTIQGKNWRMIPCGLKYKVMISAETTHSKLPNDAKLHAALMDVNI